MPMYRIKCNKCGMQDDIYRKIADYDNLPDCCGVKTQRVLCATFVSGDISPYQSQVDGSMITSKTQHREHLKQHGLVEIGNEVKAHMTREKPKVDKEAIRRDISQAIDQLSH